MFCRDSAEVRSCMSYNIPKFIRMLEHEILHWCSYSLQATDASTYCIRIEVHSVRQVCCNHPDYIYKINHNEYTNCHLDILCAVQSRHVCSERKDQRKRTLISPKYFSKRNIKCLTKAQMSRCQFAILGRRITISFPFMNFRTITTTATIIMSCFLYNFYDMLKMIKHIYTYMGIYNGKDMLICSNSTVIFWFNNCFLLYITAF